jgi:hypothetical protein
VLYGPPAPRELTRIYWPLRSVPLMMAAMCSLLNDLTGAHVQRVAHPLDVAVQAYRVAHGIYFDDDVALLFGTLDPQSLSRLMHAIVARQVLVFNWSSSIVLPRFQFDGDAPIAVKPGVRAALDELRDTYDDDELALWFVRENDWLGGARPVDVVDRDGGEALRHAARADRFVAAGG